MERFNQIFSEFKSKRILVIGDAILDTFIEGDVRKLCPEAPVQIVNIQNQYHQLGGAADTASNIASLEGKVSLFSFAGVDAEGEILRRILESKSIEYFLDKDARTLNRSRILVKGQQLLRLDRGDVYPKRFSQAIEKELLKKAQESDLIVISDDAKGAVNQGLMKDLADYRQKIIIDPKPENKLLYQGVLLITPNEEEAQIMSGCPNVFDASRKLKSELNTNVLVARGKKGMLLSSDQEIEIPTASKEIYDLIGAGETVSAALSLAISSGASMHEAAILANYAAGITIEKKGNYSVTLQELTSKILTEGRKIKNLDELSNIIQDLKRKDKSIVWTNGCYDLIHTGHLKSLRHARELGDILVVGITCDESVRMEKGSERPIHSENDRAEILASMGFIDYITVYPHNGAKICIERLKPDFYVKGGDYTLESINQEERAIVESYGGKIVLSEKVQDKSTTRTVNKIKKK